MNKYPLIGVSILDVVLLILGSLSNVVGYQSVKSTAVNDSPLFNLRMQRATNQQQNILTSQYLGMGKGNNLQFPIRNNRTEQLKKAIDIINKMDEKSFARFTELCIQRIYQDKSSKDTNPNDVIKALKLMNTKPVLFFNTVINRNNQYVLMIPMTICDWFLGCLPYVIISLLLFLYALIHGLTSGESCIPTCFLEIIQ